MNRFIRFFTISAAAPVLVAAVALLALGTTSIFAPAWAQEPGGGPLACLEGQGAFFSDTNTWECGNFIGPDKIVFVTSTVTQGDMTFEGTYVTQTLSGIVNAIKECNALATAAELQPEGSENFLPWLGDETFSPALNFLESSGPYIHLGNKLNPFSLKYIAFNWIDLTNGNLNEGITKDEADNITFDQRSWTGPIFTGVMHKGDLGTICKGWTSKLSGDLGLFGEHDKTDEDWTSPAKRLACNVSLPIYCFEQ